MRLDVMRSDQIRSDELRSDQIRSDSHRQQNSLHYTCKGKYYNKNNEPLIIREEQLFLFTLTTSHPEI